MPGPNLFQRLGPMLIAGLIGIGTGIYVFEPLIRTEIQAKWPFVHSILNPNAPVDKQIPGSEVPKAASTDSSSKEKNDA